MRAAGPPRQVPPARRARLAATAIEPIGVFRGRSAALHVSRNRHRAQPVILPLDRPDTILERNQRQPVLRDLERFDRPPRAVRCIHWRLEYLEPVNRLVPSVLAPCRDTDVPAIALRIDRYRDIAGPFRRDALRRVVADRLVLQTLNRDLVFRHRRARQIGLCQPGVHRGLELFLVARRIEPRDRLLVLRDQLRPACKRRRRPVQPVGQQVGLSQAVVVDPHDLAVLAHVHPAPRRVQLALERVPEQPAAMRTGHLRRRTGLRRIGAGRIDQPPELRLEHFLAMRAGPIPSAPRPVGIERQNSIFNRRTVVRMLRPPAFVLYRRTGRAFDDDHAARHEGPRPRPHHGIGIAFALDRSRKMIVIRAQNQTYRR